MMPHMTKHQLRAFIGLFRYYRDMLVERSHLIQLLSALTPDKVTFKWEAVGQRAF